MLARVLFNDGSVAHSQGFRSVLPFGSHGLAELPTLHLQEEGKGPRGYDTFSTSPGVLADVPVV